jgi:hypothetical protein
VTSDDRGLLLTLKIDSAIYLELADILFENPFFPIYRNRINGITLIDEKIMEGGELCRCDALPSLKGLEPHLHECLLILRI